MGKGIARLLRLPLEVLLTVLIVLDELARPLYRPLLRWVATWRLMRRLEAWVAARHRFTILVLLAIPFAIVEPLKVLALLWIGRGALVPGGITLALAYLAGFVLVERVYSAGRDKLLTIGWFAWLMAIVAGVREAVSAWARQTAVWQFAARIRARLKR
jgi:hypothetical protein